MSYKGNNVVGPFSLSEAAYKAMERLWSGKVCVSDEYVIQELGRLGLACRFDLRQFRNCRITLTSVGARYRPNTEVSGGGPLSNDKPKADSRRPLD